MRERTFAGSVSGAIDPAFVCITCLLLTADIFSLRCLLRLRAVRERGTLFPIRAQQGWILGERGTATAEGRGGAATARDVIYHRPGLSIRGALIR